MNAEFIRAIKEIKDWDDMDGYQVTTDQHEYRVLIDNWQNCCEKWGYIASEDDLEGYVGAALLEVRLTDTALNTEILEQHDLTYFEEGSIQFVDFVTDQGTFQLAVYNGHNGYYGHSIRVTKDAEVLLDGGL